MITIPNCIAAVWIGFVSLFLELFWGGFSGAARLLTDVRPSCVGDNKNAEGFWLLTVCCLIFWLHWAAFMWLRFVVGQACRVGEAGEVVVLCTQESASLMAVALPEWVGII